jgi:hypothetical protein
MRAHQSSIYFRNWKGYIMHIHFQATVIFRTVTYRPPGSEAMQLISSESESGSQTYKIMRTKIIVQVNERTTRIS